MVSAEPLDIQLSLESLVKAESLDTPRSLEHLVKVDIAEIVGQAHIAVLAERAAIVEVAVGLDHLDHLGRLDILASADSRLRLAELASAESLDTLVYLAVAGNQGILESAASQDILGRVGLADFPPRLEDLVQADILDGLAKVECLEVAVKVVIQVLAVKVVIARQADIVVSAGLAPIVAIADQVENLGQVGPAD